MSGLPQKGQVQIADDFDCIATANVICCGYAVTQTPTCTQVGVCVQHYCNVDLYANEVAASEMCMLHTKQ